MCWNSYYRVVTYITSDELEKYIKLTKNGKCSGEITLIGVEQVRTWKVQSNISTIVKSYINRNVVFQTNGEMPLQSKYLRNLTEENRKCTEELVFLITAIKYALKAKTQNCLGKKWNGFRKGRSCTDQTFFSEIINWITKEI
jgi:hypothetical protein